MKTVLVLSAAAILAFSAPAQAGFLGGGHGHRGNDALVNVDVGDLQVLNGAYFLNGIYVGNNPNVLSGILNGNAVGNGSNLGVLQGLGVNLLSNNRRSGKRW